jgi:hypothetical protein
LLTPIGKLTPAQALVADNQKKLGLSFETSQGQLVPVASIIAQVGPLIKGMGAAQATAMLQSIGFGSASAKLVSTIQAGPAVFLADEAAVTKAGSAHDAAAKQSHTLGVEFKTLKSADDRTRGEADPGPFQSARLGGEDRRRVSEGLAEDSSGHRGRVECG